jgi:hypothetical protein
MKTATETKQFNAFALAVNNVLPRFLGPKMDEYLNDLEKLKKDLEECLNQEMYYKDIIDYSINFDQLTFKGNYAVVEYGVNARNHDTRKDTKEKEVVFRIVKIPEEMVTEKVLAYLETQKIRRATNYELAYFGYLHPELQKKFMIYSLTRSKRLINEMRNCLCLSYHPKDDKRILVKSPFLNCFPKNSCFLGVYEPNINQKK